MPGAVTPGGRRLIEQMYVLHKAASGAYYNHSNCLILAASAVRVLAACLASTDVLQSARYVIEFDELLREVADFVSVFSRRRACTICTLQNSMAAAVHSTCSWWIATMSQIKSHGLHRHAAGPG